MDSIKRMVKSVYRQFYEKLSREWIGELGVFSNCPVDNQTSAEMVVVHLVFGLTFICSFVDDFRQEFARFRKKRFLF